MGTPINPPISVRCPVCLEAGRGPHPMVLRTNRNNGSEFLGCSQFPECTYSTALPAWYELRKAGAEPLPGFE